MKTLKNKIRLILQFAIVILLLSITYSCKKTTPNLEHKITFIANGGTNIASVLVKDGHLLPKSRVYPDPIVSDGGKFISWYSDEDLQDEFDFSEPITKDLTLYAKWFYNTFTISFVMNGAGDKSDIEVREGKLVELEKPTYNGFIFINWYEDPELNKPFNLNEPINENKKIYVRWLAESPSDWFDIDNNGVLTRCSPPDGTDVVIIPSGVKVIPAWFVLANGLNEPGKPGFPTGKNIKEFVLPETVESIGQGAFKYAGITSFILPPKVKVLESGVFQGCTQLKSFGFAVNSELESIKGSDLNEATIEAPALETIVFPPSLKYVGKYTLLGCTSLKSITFERSESPVIFDSFLAGGGVWLFGGYFPNKIRVPLQVKDSFVSEMRKVMQDYEFDNMKNIVEGY